MVESGSTTSDERAMPEVNSVPSVLIVDDLQINRVQLRQYLSGTRYEVDEAENGAIALEKVKARHYCFVLMDLLMPEMDGFDAMRSIRKWEDSQACPNACIIVSLTGWRLKEAGLESLMCGADAYLTKPIGRAKLLEVLSTQRPRVSSVISR